MERVRCVNSVASLLLIVGAGYVMACTMSAPSPADPAENVSVAQEALYACDQFFGTWTCISHPGTCCTRTGGTYTSHFCVDDFASNPSYCGNCNTNCPSRENATRTCTNGVCGYICNSGYGDCNGLADDGCETNLNTVVNCGNCGAMCITRPHASVTCTNGACTFACYAGYGNCNGVDWDGCESSLNNNVNNCGGCGNACVLPHATAACSAGQCAIASCNTDFDDGDSNPTNGCEAPTRWLGQNGLELSVPKATYAAGEQIIITVKLTNTSPTPCKMIQLTEGSVTISALTRDGSPVIPRLTSASYTDGMTNYLLQHLVSVPPGGSVSVLWRSEVWTASQFRDTLATYTMGHLAGADVAAWPVQQPGAYNMTVKYTTPQFDERAPTDLCRFTDAVSIGFTVTGGM